MLAQIPMRGDLWHVRVGADDGRLPGLAVAGDVCAEGDFGEDGVDDVGVDAAEEFGVCGAGGGVFEGSLEAGP